MDSPCLMSDGSPTPALLAYIDRCLMCHGWLGRMFGVHRWLLGGTRVNDRAASISVVAIRHHPMSAMRYTGFAALRMEDIPFQGILIDIVRKESDLPTLENRSQDADMHLLFAPDTPWYTAFNVGAACAGGNVIIFINGYAEPSDALLRAYRDAFQTYPETRAARGAIRVPGLEGCDCQVTGSFALAEETEFWPVDLDENMAVLAEDFFALGGFDESLIGGYGALDLSIRLFGRRPEYRCQRYVPKAQLTLVDSSDSGLPFESYLLQRHRAWLELNDSYKRYLGLYASFWQEQCGGGKHIG